MTTERDRELAEKIADNLEGAGLGPHRIIGLQPRTGMLMNCERWLRLNVKVPKGKPAFEPTAKQVRCAELIEHYMGLHHAPDGVRACTDSGIEVIFHRGYSFATFDFSEMTRLTLLAHDMRVRVQIHAKGMQLALMLHARDREGGMSFRHPTIETVLADHREKFPEGWHE